MRRLSLLSAVIVVLIGTVAAYWAATPPPIDAANCRFSLGFATLHELIPEVVGECKANERYNFENGDAFQETTRGLLVWRKADNFTAFTDGNRSWVNGPNGLQDRLNTERFPWERDTARDTAKDTAKETAKGPCAVSASSVSFGRFVTANDGSVASEGTVRNPCNATTNVMIDVYARTSKDGPVLIESPTIFVRNLGPNASKPVKVRIPEAKSAKSFTWSVSTAGSTDECFDGAEKGCLKTDPWLKSALAALKDIDEGAQLINVAAAKGVRIQRGRPRLGTYANYVRATRSIVIDSKLDSSSSWVRAAVLSHELQHAADYASGSWPATAEACYRAEAAAFRLEAIVWRKLWGDRLPDDVDSIHTELNDVTLWVEQDPISFAELLAVKYEAQCTE